MVGTTLKALLNERGITVSELARRMDVSTQTLYSIIKRDNMKIDLELLLKLCSALGVSPERFIGAPEPEGPDAAEWELLRKFRSLDAHGQRLTRLILDAETDRVACEAEDDEPETKIIPLFYTPAAAGLASPALGEDYEDYTVSAASPADFAARIDGDSMEPYIEDGSVVLVRRGTNLSDGDVGLFFVDGDMKCKQFCQDSQGNMYLFSLNRERKDADMTISASSGVAVMCFGKVLMDRRPPLP